MMSLSTPVSTIVGTALCFLLLNGCKSEHPVSGESQPILPAATVTTMTAAESAPARQVEIMGTVQAAENASIAAKISGNITDIPVSPGSRVREGDLLAAISAGEISAKLMQAQAQLEQATRNYTREQGLLKKNAATVEMVKTLEETKKIAEAAYREARTMLSYTSITAPFDGIITKKHVNIGDLATPGSPLLQLESESQLQVITHIPESLILEISIDDRLPVYIPAADVNITGIVTEVAPTADPRSRTAPVKLQITPAKNIRSGQFARVSLPGTRGKAILLPETALQPFGQMERVFAVEDDKARMRLVKTGLRHDGKVEILSGIIPGEEIVVSADIRLQDAQPLNPR
ncbi:MAG: efflux RND transporter periplasmic adaptor subunit [Desulfocapsaceae bacterium]|jgi:RND family efflux transporter MFP subunit|nr:efflux RND transporter periplasmic adaptor subunit [Desulfocapsaceae bacterium]